MKKELNLLVTLKPFQKKNVSGLNPYLMVLN